MQQHTLKSKSGSRKKHHRRGIGDTFAGRGCKGQQSRVGGRSKFTAGFEGGQISLIRRMPKLGGFTNPNRVPYQPVNLSDLETRFSADVADSETLLAAGLIKKANQPVKILGTGGLKKKLTVKVDAASKSAIAAIEKAGGTVELPKKVEKVTKAKKTAAAPA